MFVIGVLFVIIVGILMVAKPQLVFEITEAWKSNGSAEPTKAYILSIRFGGVMFLLVGIGCGVLSFFAI